MSCIRNAAAIAASVSLAACAISPLPDDVTGVSTVEIVRKIRCETRDAVIQKLIAYFASHPQENVRDVGLAFQNGRSIRTLDVKKEFKEPAVQATILDVIGTGVAYNFTFDISETNDLAIQANLLKPFTDGKFSLGPKYGDSRGRNNTRSFTITDNFRDLIVKLPAEYCNFEIPGPNYVYPIVGRIGIDEKVNTFVDLALHANLSPPEQKALNGKNGKNGKNGSNGQKKESPKKGPTMVDSIAFQTKFSGSVTPKIELSVIRHNFTLTEAFLTGATTRDDKHKVTIGFILPSTVAKQRSFQGFRSMPGFMSVPYNLLTASPASDVEQAAADAVSQHIFRFELLNARGAVAAAGP